MPSTPGNPGPDRGYWLGEWAYAHRGLHGAGVPENSRMAFQAAIARGLGIECDIQISADGRAMVFHDWELDRLTGESGPVAARSAAELGHIALSRDSTIGTLDDLLYLVAGRVPLLIEIKSRHAIPVVPVCRAVRRALAGYGGLFAVMSFDPRVGRWFANAAPEMLRGLVVTEEGDRGARGKLKRWLALGHSRADFLAYDIRDLPSRFAARQRRRGLPVLTWTVRSRELRERALLHADAPIAEGAGLA